MSLAARKSFLTLCRVQKAPYEGAPKRLSNLYKDLDVFYTDFRKSDGPGTYKTYTFSHIDSFLSGRWEDPVWMGLISMMLRVIPAERSEIDKSIRDGFSKEFDTLQRGAEERQLDYKILEEYTLDGLFPDIQMSPVAAKVISDGIHSWLRTVNDMLILPRSSTKRASITTALDFAAKINRPDYAEQAISLGDVESVYSRTGLIIGGICEMRYAMKPNDLKPRWYWCCGGILYHSSKYIQPICTALVDSFPATDTISRFSIERFNLLTDEEILIMYDFTTFTTNMCESRYFLTDLANRARHISVRILDTYEGIKEQSLTELLHDYNEACNHFAEFDIRDKMILEGTFRHIRAGFLGVLGNIASCTALHGIALVSMLEGGDDASVVGDDAIGRFMDNGDTVSQCIRHLKLIGDINEEKAESFRDEGESFEIDAWHYCKRPVQRVGGKMYQGYLFDWPQLHNMMRNGGPPTSYHTIFNTTPQKYRRTFLTQTGSFFSSLWRSGFPLDEETKDLIFNYIAIGYREWGMNFHGGVGGVDSIGYFGPYPPIDGTYRFERDWLDWILENFRNEEVSIPVEYFDTDIRPSFHDGMIYTSNALLSLLVRLEYIRSEPLYTTVILDDVGFASWARYIRGQSFDRSYRYFVCDVLPEWFLPLYETCADT